ncbi:MAG: RNA-binding S4 domain-containing protein, partial [Gemmataceae bacterium]
SVHRGPAMSERTVTLRGDHITLAQAIKVAGLADTGGSAKVAVREGTYAVNGEEETRPARKLRAGDRFRSDAAGEWTVVAGP